jgi:hypothetical protein
MTRLSQILHFRNLSVTASSRHSRRTKLKTLVVIFSCIKRASESQNVQISQRQNFVMMFIERGCSWDAGRNSGTSLLNGDISIPTFQGSLNPWIRTVGDRERIFLVVFERFFVELVKLWSDFRLSLLHLRTWPEVCCSAILLKFVL